tara:strand:+ start:13340 stop:14191 length:852 start_codon:yes stop_codon:yes gene_type:complete
MIDKLKEREPLNNGVFGLTGIGKSYQLEKEMEFYTIRTMYKEARKVLIFDPQGESTKYPEISFKNIGQFTKPMIMRINGRKWSAEEKREVALNVFKLFTNGMYVINDIDNFAAYSRDQDLIGTLMSNRHKSVDLTLIHQSLEMASPNFWRNSTTVRIHKQTSNDTVLRDRCKEADYYELLKISSTVIDNQFRAGNKRFYLTVNLRERKIFGCSHEQNFLSACKEYLALHPVIIKHEVAKMIAFGKISTKESKSEKAYLMAQDRILQRLILYRDTTGTTRSLYI